jgi:glycerophosphoryl diester phosphodiesterase
LNGNTDHFGIKEILDLFQFDKIIDYKNVGKTGHESTFGIRDKDLFSLAKNEIIGLKSSNKRFALFISTTDTHFPGGIYDERMESVIPRKNSNLEFMVASLDYLIGDFISFLQKNMIMENTTIYLFPDHLKMGDPSIFKDLGERGLYLITNSGMIKESNETIYQIDLPKIILNGSNIKHNLKFLTDYIPKEKGAYINNNILTITEINTNGILNPSIEAFNPDNVSKNFVNYKNDTSRYIAHAGGKIEGKVYTNSLEALNLSYQKGFRLFELDIIQTIDGEFVAAHDWKHWSKITNYSGSIPVSREQFLKIKLFGKYTPLDMDAINSWFYEHKDAILVTDKVNDPIKFSGCFIDKNRLMMELFDEQSVNDGIKAGILSAMPSQSLISNLSRSDVKELAQKGIKNIAISRSFISNNKDLLLEFKKYNIKVFAYHVNVEPGIDEAYVTKYEMDYIYGIYADVWGFK